MQIVNTSLQCRTFGSGVELVRPKVCFCEGCIYGKQHKFPLKQLTKRLVRFLKHKDDVLSCFEEMVNMCKNKVGNNVQRLRVGIGSEFMNSHFKEYLCSKGIVLETTAPYLPEQH
ncbi:hypothetical protein PR048_016613 [Dryococelus australis]|uniref:Uncharacterized protein n=1 Tax=Dryococelus australis TaxID=614101 RepID=A0ABQ9H7D6_9NEOP|nr:hypothetical protein PR048_016613 [Dryococelus australis]